jgi:hypothetical protein
MKDFSELFVDKTEIISEQSIEVAHQDNSIESIDELPHLAIENHFSHVLSAMVALLSHSQDSKIQPIVQVVYSTGY